VQVLDAIAQAFNVCGVLTAPDKPLGRSRKPVPPPVKTRAVELGIRVFQPDKLDVEARDRIRSLNPDLLVVSAFHKIFRQSFIDLFPSGGINVHPSLLPKYRGPSPVQAAILAGDRETGVTIQRLALKMDVGDILSQEKVIIGAEETAPELLERTFRIGARMIVNVIARIARGDAEGRPQKESDATYCRLIDKSDGEIDWAMPAEAICRMIRAYLQWPKAYTSYSGKQLSLLEAVPLETASCGHERVPGLVCEVDMSTGILIHTGHGMLCARRLQLQGKKALSWQDFANGHRSFVGARLGGI
jgi:methionyl-tRNA formyltransferase